MGRIRIVGRSRRGRCVFCHDDLAGEEVYTCPGCHATWHQECRAELERCPTRGCTGPSPQRERRRGRPRRRRERAGPVRPFERQGRTRRGDAVAALRRSAIWTACLMLASGAYLSWPLMSWSSFMKVASVEEDGGGLIVLLVLGVAALCTFLGTLHWLCRLPGVFREVNHLLDSTEPTLMRLTVRKRVTPDSDGQATTSWEASLAGDGPDSRLSFTVSGFLPPRWLRSERFWNTPVLVYGLPPPGPYLIELEDGSLAVVHP